MANLAIILDSTTIRRTGRFKIHVHHDKTSLANYVKNTSSDPSWMGFITAFRNTVTELKEIEKFRNITRRNIFRTIRTAYMGIVWRDLSIDLVAASLRQREFAKKITSDDCLGMDSPFSLFKATTRYHKFLLLMKRNDKKKVPLVPTLDIDLCWHTHQLSPVPYRQWCVEHLGMAINHDDTIGKGSLDQGLRETSLSWFDAYREGYTTDDLKESYLSRDRKFAGIVFPPYGLYMLHKARKLEQARTGIFIYVCLINH